MFTRRWRGPVKNLGSVARSKGVRPLQIDYYFDIFSSFKVAWVIHARYVLLKHRSPPCSKMDEG